MPNLLLYSCLSFIVIIVTILLYKNYYDEKFSDTPCASCDSCCQPQNPKIVGKFGNDGNATCDQYCTVEWNGQPAYSQAAYAYDTILNKFVPTSLQTFHKMICGCASP